MSTLDPNINLELRDLISIHDFYIHRPAFNIKSKFLGNTILRSFECMYPVWQTATNEDNVTIGNRMYKLIEPYLKNKKGLYITNFSTSPWNDGRRYFEFSVWDEENRRSIIELEFVL